MRAQMRAYSITSSAIASVRLDFPQTPHWLRVQWLRL